MDISREVATAKGPAETFTSEVWIDPITRGLPPSLWGSKTRPPVLTWASMRLARIRG